MANTKKKKLKDMTDDEVIAYYQGKINEKKEEIKNRKFEEITKLQEKFESLFSRTLSEKDYNNIYDLVAKNINSLK